METLLKIGITLVICVLIYYQVTFLKWTWSTQIDPKATFARFLKKAKPEVDVIAIRDPNKIYQNGNVVGEVTGSVENTEGFIIFKQLCETTNLDRNAPFEHKRDKYQIVKITRSIGMKIVASTTNSEQKTAVLEDIFCKKIE